MASLRTVQAAVAEEFLRPFEWGKSDCCLAVANVLLALGYEDVAAPWRGTYDSAMVMRTDLMGDIAAHVASLGWPEVETPEARCFGFSSSLGGAIFDGVYWWGKSSRGMARVGRPAVIWRPMCRPSL
ncbi:MAG: hypothetical protein AAF092_05090 [Pseudomonadota bacterium]